MKVGVNVGCGAGGLVEMVAADGVVEAVVERVVEAAVERGVVGAAVDDLTAVVAGSSVVTGDG